MKNDPFVAEPFGPVANLGRRLREIFGEAHGGLDDRMIELLHELDFIPSYTRQVGPGSGSEGLPSEEAATTE